MTKLGGALSQEAAHAARVPALLMLVPNGDLDQAVQKPPPRAGGAAPHFLPLIVAPVELTLVEEA